MTSTVASSGPTYIAADRVRAALPFGALVQILRDGFAGSTTVPGRHHHAILQPDGATATLLVMPAWQNDYLGVKIATIHPGNPARAMPAVHSTYLLSDAATGRPLALIDGDEITARRTLGVSALAADYLARADATRLLIVGAGRVASQAAEAFRAVRPITRVDVWNPHADRAAALVGRLRKDGIDAGVVASLEEAARAADIICCATLSTKPLIRGVWLRPGTHLDLIGGFTPDMREVDDACLAGARIIVDTEAAIGEAGDLVQPIRDGAIVVGDIAGTLADLCTGRIGGRGDAAGITVFKSVGTALADIAAAAAAYRALASQDPS